MQQEDLNNKSELVEYNELVNKENKKKKKLKCIQFIFWYISIVLIAIIVYESYKTYKLNNEVVNNENQESEYVNEAYETNKNIDRYIEEVIASKNGINQENREYAYNKPFIPEGFDDIDGNWNDGYIIVDENGNQFVWVPCTLDGVNDTTKLDRYDFCVEASLDKKYCKETDENIKKFIDSVGKYQGFWISRYEIGNEDGKAISKGNINVWNNISQDEAKEVSKKFYENKDNVNSSLINSYAWDTTLKWIDKTNYNFSVSSIDKGYHGKNLRPTGNYSVNNIHDLAGNAWEWTTESAYDGGVYRAGFTAMDYSSIGEPGFRGLINSDGKYYLIGFRMIMYAN